MSDWLQLRNGQNVATGAIPTLEEARFRAAVCEEVGRGKRLVALFARPATSPGGLRLFALIGSDESGTLGLASCEIGDTLVSMTSDCPEAHWAEREIAEQWGVSLVGHPWPKPVRFHAPYYNHPKRVVPEIGVVDFFEVGGDEVHEVAVGPVHAGIIEPGHFRFQCHGERVMHLEISLGYQHRGVERALLTAPAKRRLQYVETSAGDTTIAHTTAYCQVAESLGASLAPARAVVLRGVALELERIANHVGDLGALSGDVGFLPTAAYCGRIRGDFLNMTALLCGSRFGRGLVRPGGVAFDVDDSRVAELGRCLASARQDVENAVGLLFSSASVLARFEGTGLLSRRACNELGLVGPPARAAGIERDVRQDYAFGVFRVAQIPISTWTTGDVYGRAFVRWLEVQRSMAFVRARLSNLPGGPCDVPVGPLEPGRTAVSLVEGFRGEVAHIAQTGPAGELVGYKIVDPSFHNWFGLAMALRGQEISDFPLCNKSFNLSYCGHDL